ncbi:MAG: bifunctional diguanylate cyclase/phosphodiesterase [Actinomycetales bacterium]|nr:bifunctional diguanylate cyclase/phosphodiesterase [Actinomycetales bacterium]
MGARGGTADAPAPRVRALASKHLWKAHLAVGAAAVVAIMSMPDALPRDLVYEALPLSVPVAVVVGLGLHRPRRRAAWVLLAVAGALWALGDAVWAWAEHIIGADPTASLANALYLAAYPMLAVALALVGRHRRPRRDLPSILDSLVVTAVAALVVWVLILEPVWSTSGGVTVDRVIGAAYPIFDLIVVLQLTFVWVSGTRRPAALTLLLAAVSVVLVSDLVYNVGPYVPALAVVLPWLDAGWLTGYLLWGAAALHPSMAVIDQVAGRPAAGLTVGRVLGLGLAFAMLPILRLVSWFSGRPASLVVVGSINLLIVVLLVVRLIDVMTTVRAQSARLAHLANTDFVTDLDNGRRFAERLEEGSCGQIAASKGRRAAVLMVGVERFAELNAMLGHAVGDEILRTVGAALRAVAGPDAALARLGSDVFGIAAELRDADDAFDLATRVRDLLGRPLDVAGLGLVVEGAVGLVLLPDDATEVDLALERADAALTAAWLTSGRMARFGPGFDGHRASPRLVAELRDAIEDGEIEVYLQPQVNVATGRVTGAEALARWRHPERGIVLPGSFIPVAERSGLIRPLTLRVLEQSLAQCAAWRAQGLDLSVAVNLSVRNLLDPNLVGDVRQMLALHGLHPSRLELEITETMAMVDPARTLQVLGELARLEVRLAVDDYGTGYSSLAYLQTLPVSRLKIDRTFVADLSRDQASRAIVASTIDLARRLGLGVVAEGVEEAASLAVLADLGCDEAQGFGLGRPVEAGAFVAEVGRIEGRLARPGGWGVVHQGPRVVREVTG